MHRYILFALEHSLRKLHVEKSIRMLKETSLVYEYVVSFVSSVKLRYECRVATKNIVRFAIKNHNVSFEIRIGWGKEGRKIFRREAYLACKPKWRFLRIKIFINGFGRRLSRAASFARGSLRMSHREPFAVTFFFR